MKKIRVIALAMALVMIAMCAAACASEKVSVNCTVSVEIDGETYLDSYAYTVQNKAETPPTILQAVTEVFTIIEYNYAVDDAGQSLELVTVDGVDYAAGKTADGTAIGYWSCTVDGVEPEGRMGLTAVQEGQHIVVSYSTMVIEEQVFSSGEE